MPLDSSVKNKNTVGKYDVIKLIFSRKKGKLALSQGMRGLCEKQIDHAGQTVLKSVSGELAQ